MPQVIAPDEIKSLIGNLARPNYYQMTFSLPQNAFLRNYLRARGVDDIFINQEAGLLCNAASLPGSNLATTENYNKVGVKENFAHTLLYDQLRLEFYVDNTYKTLKFFEHWIGFIGSGNGALDVGSPSYSRELRYPDEYKSNGCKLFKFENDNRSRLGESPIITKFFEYSFIGLYPTDIFEIPVTYENGAGVMNMTVAFNYDRHVAGSINSLDVFNFRNNNLESIVRGAASSLARGALDIFIN